MQAARSKQIQGYLSTHSLAETYSVLTRMPIQPKISPAAAESIVLGLMQYLEIIPLVATDYQAAISQMVALNIAGGGIFDALIAQAALKAKVDRLLTLNPNHFARLDTAILEITQVPT